MTAESFAYWLNGFFELTDAKELTTEQVAMIKEHLQLVFNKETKLKLGSGQINFNNYWTDYNQLANKGFQLHSDGVNQDIPICSQNIPQYHTDGVKLPPVDFYLNPLIGNIPPNASC